MKLTHVTHIAKKGIIGLVVAIVIVTIVLFLLNRNSNNTTRINLASPQNIENVPTLPYDQGGGINKNTDIVRKSEFNIKKLLTHLPYEQKITTSNGIDIEILIPSAEFQENPWTFTVNIYGIDYEAPEGTTEYQAMHTAFREAAADIFNFMKAHGANPDEVIIKWGGRLFIEKRATEWLQ